MELCPFALQYEVYLYNHKPQQYLLYYLLCLFIWNQTYQNHLRWEHMWGCTTYVIDKNIQYGKKFTNCQTHWRHEEIILFLLNHSSLFGLIQKLITVFVYLKFQVIFSIWSQIHKYATEIHLVSPCICCGGWLFPTKQINIWNKSMIL